MSASFDFAGPESVFHEALGKYFNAEPDTFTPEPLGTSHSGIDPRTTRAADE